MADYIVTSGELTTVANAIREKNGTSSSLSWPDEFVSGISSGSGGGGSSDFSTAEVTIVNTGESTWALVAPIVLEEGTQTYPIGMYSALEGIIAGNTTTVVKVALFSGHAYIDTMANPFTVVSTSGNITLNNDICDITGDCTITIS